MNRTSETTAPVAVDGLNTRTEGRGAPAFLFVHGYACGLEDWSTMFDALSGDHLCVALDLPGHCGSASAEEPTIAAMARATNTVKDRIRQPVILVGHSLGAKIIREAVCQSPGNVLGLVLIDGGYYGDNSEPSLVSEGERTERIGFDAFVRRHFDLLFPAEADPVLKHRIIDRASRLEPGFGRALYLAAIEFDIARSVETLAQIPQPILNIQTSTTLSDGRRRSLGPDETTPMSDLIAQRGQDAELRVLTGCGHFPAQERPAALADELRRFAARLAD